MVGLESGPEIPNRSKFLAQSRVGYFLALHEEAQGEKGSTPESILDSTLTHYEHGVRGPETCNHTELPPVETRVHPLPGRFLLGYPTRAQGSRSGLTNLKVKAHPSAEASLKRDGRGPQQAAP